MARSKKSSAVKPQEPSQITRFDEANSARLGLICAQERIPPDYTRWDIEIPIDDRVARLTCISPAEYGGVPHGLDGDFATALNLIYLEQGSPTNGEVQVTAYQLLQKAGFADSGQYYASLQESLDRLKGATYTASESWRDKRQERWTTVKFNFIEQIEADTAGTTEYGDGTMLRIRLARPVVQSLREQYLKPLDMTFVQSLSRSITRSVYRMLDARRYDPVTMSDAMPVVRMSLMQWARELKLLETVPARVKRNLEGAHKELLERGYLADVSYEGSRGATVIVYTFGDLPASLPAPEPALQVLPDPPVVDALRRHGVAVPVARKLVSEFGENHVTVRLERFQAILAGGYQPQRPSAFLVDVIKDSGEKYGNLLQVHRPLPTDVERHERKAKTVELPEPEVSELNGKLAREFQSLPLEEQAARAATSVRMFVGRELKDSHIKRLLASMLEGEVEPLLIQQQVIRAAHELKLQDFAAEIKAVYG